MGYRNGEGMNYKKGTRLVSKGGSPYIVCKVTQHADRKGLSPVDEPVYFLYSVFFKVNLRTPYTEEQMEQLFTEGGQP